ncbi:MAG: ribonuclease HI [Anaerolineales bacterium]|nr:ribonuclease HI [Anaerolineales bacterium]MDW8162027.1 ribonuclease HI [Anaerolineales bacterium]
MPLTLWAYTMGKRQKLLYLVLRGRKPGVYLAWEGLEGAKLQVDGFANALYRGFYTTEEAVHWLKAQTERPLPESLQEWLAKQEEALASSSSPSLRSKIENHLRSGGTVIFTDGCALGNPGPGGYAAVILRDSAREELSGGFRSTTNNRMELYACIAALEHLQPPAQVLLITDSAYVFRATTEGWLQNWATNGWKRRDGKTIQNLDLWQRFHRLCQVFSVEFHWIKGHNATAENERCDHLALSSAQQSELPEDPGYSQRNWLVLPA